MYPLPDLREVAGLILVIEQYNLFLQDPVPELRDVAVILLAIESIVALGIFIFLGLKLIGVVNTLSRQTGPILETTHRAANTAAGTTDFISRLVVTPLIRVLTAVAAAIRFIQVLLGGSRRRHQ